MKYHVKYNTKYHLLLDEEKLFLNTLTMNYVIPKGYVLGRIFSFVSQQQYVKYDQHGYIQIHTIFNLIKDCGKNTTFSDVA